MKYLIILGFFLSYNIVLCSIVSVSSIKQCVNDGSGEILKQPNGTSCRKKLVVAMTVEANEGKAQNLEVNLHRVHDSTVQTDLELKTPIRVRVIKSPVTINYRLYQLGYVNASPYEIIRRKRGRRCRDDWYSKNSEAPCRFQYDEDNERIFDSQGFCCSCSYRRKGYDRGESVKCLGRSETAHCLRMHPLHVYVFGLYPPQLHYKITITFEMASTSVGNKVSYKEIGKLELGPSKRISTSDTFQFRAEYIADFHPTTFMPVLAHKYLMIPHSVRNPPRSTEKPSTDLKDTLPHAFDYNSFVNNVSQWLLVDKHYYDFSGLHCNKIGVSYSAFRNQPGNCRSRAQECLQGQPLSLWYSDNEKIKKNLKPKYQLHSFGKVHSVPHSNGRTDFQLNFIADRTQKSLITMSMEADSLAFVVNKSPGRIVDAYIDPFESLSIDGYLNVYVQNTGDITATYAVSVGHCSGGIDYIPSKSVTIDPGKDTNVSFVVHSFHSVGQINTCKVELLNQESEVLDNLTITFETLDTCFCYGYCGCTCGNNVTECPPKPTYQDPDAFTSLRINIPEPEIKFLQDLRSWVGGSLGAILVSGWIVTALIALGGLKVILLLSSGNIQCPATTCICCCKCCYTAFSRIWGKCGECLCTLLFCGAMGVSKFTTTNNKNSKGSFLSSNTARPTNCDSMCSGAKQARRAHRKKLRKMKREGVKMDRAEFWWETKYDCTCVVNSDGTKSILGILKGLFFFIYCPFLPVWWSLEIVYEWYMRRRARQRRKMEFRAKKEAKQMKDKDKYLLLDKYTRGKKEKKVVDFKKQMKKTKDQAKEMEEGGQMLRFSSDEALGLDSADTTATDEAMDIDELTDPGYPVYMNYAGSANVPKSLKSPGKCFSVKGRIREIDGEFLFDLHKYTTQIKFQTDGKISKLSTTVKLLPEEFEQSLQRNVVQLLVTLSPLFTCLNK